jgi:hypothetical protein
MFIGHKNSRVPHSFRSAWFSSARSINIALLRSVDRFEPEVLVSVHFRSAEWRCAARLRVAMLERK